MKKLIIIVVCLVSVSCQKYSEGFNIDPNNFTDAPGESVIGQANLAWVLMTEGEASRLAGIFTDQFTGFSNQFVSFNTYDMKASDFDGIWLNAYSGGLSQTRIVQDKALASGNKELLGVAQLVEAQLIAELAALFGDVPYSQSGRPVEFPNPKYDNQLEVLGAIQNLLTEAIANVGNTKVSDRYGNPIFVANGALWAEVAHTLKARYFLITKEYDKALAEAKKGIATPEKSLMAFHSEASGQRNLYYQFGIEQRGGYLTATRSYLRKMLNPAELSVQRLVSTPGEAQRYAKYFQGNELNYRSNGYFDQKAPFPIVDWFENQFILAECELRGGKDQAARLAYNKVRKELARIYNGEFPEVQADGDDLLKAILEERYITMIGSIQVFHDMRRTKNLLEIPIKNALSKRLPQRFLYPQGEINTNTSFPGVVSLFTETNVNQ